MTMTEPPEGYRYESAADQRAAWLARNHDRLGPLTKGELGDLVGLRSKGAITDVQRRADVRMEPLGVTLTNPSRDNGYRSGATAEALSLAVGLLERVRAWRAEGTRQAHKLRVVVEGDVVTPNDATYLAQIVEDLEVSALAAASAMDRIDRMRNGSTP